MLRKRTPSAAIGGFNMIEAFALSYLRTDDQHRAYQLGIVLALWLKAGEITGNIELSRADSRKVQDVYESCMKILRRDTHAASAAFSILEDIAEQQQTFGIAPEFYRQLWINVLT